ncbi:ATP-binding protein [Raineya orbicola]|jgi:serine/threonine-protein kinase RsbW|uniref:Histidine kinase-like ATPase domain n=1 Tax=Raineya orbicola TaxID=2016530 RepID=A0A2N3IHY1_9BACT|nr:ATP-binding protein [Raineya orbicola]PKQ69833.1 Histidine kinase-like ATPase domain [Raineya orbicola]
MKYNISIKAEKKNLKKVRTFLENIFAQMQVPEVERNQLILVVDEILANLIIHSAKSDMQKDIDISLSENAGEVTFEIYDYNSPYFDLTQHEDANLQDLKKQKRKGGMGLTLVKNIMDEVEVSYEDNTNIWRLQKKLPFLILKKSKNTYE